MDQSTAPDPASTWTTALNEYSYPVDFTNFMVVSGCELSFPHVTIATRDETIAFEDHFRQHAQSSIEVWLEVVYWKMYSQGRGTWRAKKRIQRAANFFRANGITSQTLWQACNAYVKNPTQQTLAEFQKLFGFSSKSIAITCTFPAFVDPNLFPMVDRLIADWVRGNHQMYGPELIPPKPGHLELRHFSFVQSWTNWCRCMATKLSSLTHTHWRARDVEMAVFRATGPVNLPPLPLTPLGNDDGHFGPYGGQFVPETLMYPVQQLAEAYEVAKADHAFREEFAYLLAHYVGRPTPLYFARRLTEHFGGAKIYLKREDLLHTGAHKINNTVGQALLTKRMGKPRVIAETGAGQHGVATATVAALFGFECVVYMGTEDMRRQALNVFRMRLLGAEVVAVDSGSRTLKDAINEAMRDWVTNVHSTHYLLGSVLGPHPYPTMVRDFQSVIGREARAQILEAEGKLPDALVACVGGGSNSIGLFHWFIEDESVQMFGVEAGGVGSALGDHAARFMADSGNRKGVLHGCFTYVLQNEEGQIAPTHSVSAGLDYPSIGPEHANLHDLGRATYVSVSDDDALDAFQLLCKLEGILPALESAHAIAHVAKLAPTMGKDQVVIVNLSGRGDKDVTHAQEELGKRKA